MTTVKCRAITRPDVSQNGGVTVGELKSAAMCVSYMPALKAKKAGKRAPEKVLLELCRRFANSIPWFCETPGKTLVKASSLSSKTLLLPSHSTSSHQLREALALFRSTPQYCIARITPQQCSA